MARQVKDSKLDTRQARLKLPVSKDPYWRLIYSGCYVGYRKGARGGSWILRMLKPGTKKYVKRVLGKADDILDSDGEQILSFRDVQHKAHELKDTLTKEHPTKVTVQYATTHYIEWFKENRKSLDGTLATINAHILPRFGDTLISELSTKEIKVWHQKLASTPARKRSSNYAKQQFRNIANTEDKKRARKVTANRILTVFKAILNKAFQDELVDDDLAWRRVKPFEKVDAPKIRFLKKDECMRLINACRPDLRQLVQAALYTGCRYGELTGLTVNDIDLDKPNIYIQPSKSNKSRHVPLTPEGLQFFQSVLLPRKNGHNTKQLVYPQIPPGLNSQVLNEDVDDCNTHRCNQKYVVLHRHVF